MPKNELRQKGFKKRNHRHQMYFHILADDRVFIQTQTSRQRQVRILLQTTLNSYETYRNIFQMEYGDYLEDLRC